MLSLGRYFPKFAFNSKLKEMPPTLNPYNPNLKNWFRLFPLRSPLLRECENSKLLHTYYVSHIRHHAVILNFRSFLFLRLLRCFTSPGSRTTLSVMKYWFTILGYPIQKSPDQRLLATSPMLIAGTPRLSSH